MSNFRNQYQQSTFPEIRLELSGDGNDPIRSTTGQRLDGDYVAPMAGCSKETMSGDCSENQSPVVLEPQNDSNVQLKLGASAKIVMDFLFNLPYGKKQF